MDNLLKLSEGGIIVQVLLLAVLVWLVFRGRLKKAGPLEFTGGVDELTAAFETFKRDKAGMDAVLAAFVERSDGNDARIMEDIQLLKRAQEDSKNDRRQIHDALSGLARDAHTLRLESLKTQILLRETSIERKLYLYDQYKKMGGNGWMDLYIQDLKDQKKTGVEE